MTTLRSLGQVLSPFTNTSSLQFPWARIAGASVLDRYLQTFEVLGGRAFVAETDTNHFGVMHYSAQTALFAHGLNRLFENAADKSESIPVVGPLMAIALNVAAFLARVVELIVHFIFVLPAAALTTLSLTPVILLTHLGFRLTKPNLEEFAETLFDKSIDKNTPNADSNETSLTASYKLISATLNGQAPSGVTLQFENKALLKDPDYRLNGNGEHLVRVDVDTPAKKAAFEQLLSYNAFGSAVFFDTHTDSQDVLDQVYQRPGATK